MTRLEDLKRAAGAAIERVSPGEGCDLIDLAEPHLPGDRCWTGQVVWFGEHGSLELSGLSGETLAAVLRVLAESAERSAAAIERPAPPAPFPQELIA